MIHKCSFCGKEFNIKPSQLKKTKNACCSKECASKLKSQLYKGENNPNYNKHGKESKIFKGEKIIQNGYYMIYIPEHPLSNKNGRIREHRYIAEKELATLDQLILIEEQYVLCPDLDVHHKDFNKLNNDINNLEILSRKEHALLHQKEKSKEHSHIEICSYCKKEYKVINSRTNNKYCSIECMNLDKRKNTIKHICPVCDSIFYSSTCQERMCCSVKCSNIYRDRGSIEFNCDYCGKKSKKKLSDFNKTKHHFCSRECYFKSRNKK